MACWPGGTGCRGHAVYTVLRRLRAGIRRGLRCKAHPRSVGLACVFACHVVQGASEMQLYYDGNGPVDLTVMAVSKGQDLCLLQTPEALPGMLCLIRIAAVRKITSSG